MRKRHWTVYAIISIAILSVLYLSFCFWAIRFHLSFENAITEAGGSVHYLEKVRPSVTVGSTVTTSVEMTLTDVAISSGSHPLPDELWKLNRIGTVTDLSLNTNVVSDLVVPKLARLKYIEKLDLTGSEVTGAGVLRLLEEMKGIKTIRFPAENAAPDEMKKLAPFASSGKLILVGNK